MQILYFEYFFLFKIQFYELLHNKNKFTMVINYGRDIRRNRNDKKS